MSGGSAPKRDGRRRLKLVLLSALVIGAITAVTVRGVYAIYSGETANRGSSVATGTLTLENSNAQGAASTTLSDKVGVTTLSGSISASATSLTVASSSSFQATPFNALIDDEQVTVTNVSGTTWTVTRGANGTQAATHANNANIYQVTVSVTGHTGFPASGDYTVLVGTEKMLVYSGQGTNTWLVRRGVDGTTPASQGSGATIATQSCKSITGTSNVNTACDSLVVYSPATELYPGSPVTTNVTIYDSGSVGTKDLELFMSSCLRGITPDFYLASSTTTAPTFSNPSTTTGALSGGTTYYYEVTAVSSSGESIAGSEAAYTPPIGTNTNSIKLTWTAVSGATSYNIYRATTEGSETEVQTGITGTSYISTGTTTLTAAITTTGQTTINVNSAANFPSSGNYVITIGSEQMLVTGGQGTTTWTVTRGYHGTTASTYSNGSTVTSGFTSATSPPGGRGSGDPCVTGNDQIYVQETNSSGTATQCWYPGSGTTCAFDGTLDLGFFATYYNASGNALDLGAGPSATSSRYFTIGAQVPSGASNTVQGTEALFILNWYGFEG